nr:reverse transcriptase domain-containing protein [Tanacetum cinerariifolium]
MSTKRKEVLTRVDLTKQALVNQAYPDQLITIKGSLSEQCKNQLRALLKESMDAFAWEPADMTRIPRRVIEHSLNLNPLMEPVTQKRRVMAFDRTQAISKEVEEWRMCIDFKNVNLACPKDYYPLPDIDGEIESVMGFQYKCFLDAYKGYHQVQMAPDDKEKTAFYTDQGTYCYTKMPFGLKNVGATYQRLVDTTFQSQIEKNLEAYADYMVIKSNNEKVLIEDIVETFDNLRRINMMLNPKKCLFGVEKGIFLGNMVISEGIRDNPKKTKAICNPSDFERDAEPKWKAGCIKKILVLHGKGDPRDEKGHSGAAIANHPGKGGNDVRIRSSGNRGRKCRATSQKKGEAMSATLCPSYKVITDQPLKQILNKAQASGKLAKYSVEFGAYNIAYEARSAMKGHVLMDFLSEAPVGTPTEEFFRVPSKLPNQDDMERWTLFIDGASNSKGSRAGLVLISPSDVDFTCSLRLNFTITNNEAEYEALLAGLRLARKMKADILCKLDTIAFDHLRKKVLIEVMAERSTDQKEVGEIMEEEENNWMMPIERREAAIIREAKYKPKMELYYNQKVRPTSFKPDEYEFWRNEASRVKDQGKLGPKWEGPYRVTEAYQNGSYKFQTMERKEVPRTWHAINHRKCYV